MIIKSVAFNPKDPDQEKMLKHAGKRTNFSGYVKRLIQRDMEGGSAMAFTNFREEDSGDRELMKSLV